MEAIIRFRNRQHGLLLSELGAYMLSPYKAPAGTKRISNLLHSGKWQYCLLSDWLRAQAKERFNNEVSAGNRGNRRYFGKNPLHNGVFHFSSMPYGDQSHLLIEAGDYILDKYDLLSLQKEITDLQLKFIDSRDRDFRKRAWADMQEISKLIHFNPDEKGLLYSEANAFDNIVNLGLEYLEQQRLELTDFVFLTEVLNRRPGTVEEGFYPMLDMKRHALDRNNNDYLIGLDFNLRKLQ